MKKLSTLTFTFVVFSLLILPVHAQSNLEDRQLQRQQKIQDREENRLERQEDRETRQLERQEQRETKIAERCENIAERVRNRISKFETNKDAHINRYDSLRDRLLEIANKLDSKDLDTTEFRAAISGLNSLVLEYARLYEDFILELEVSEDYACGESEGAYKETLEAAKDKLSIAREKRKEIVEYYRTEVRGAIQDLRNQASSGSTSDSTEE